MQTIKIVQRRDENFIPSSAGKESPQGVEIINETTLIEASHISHRPYVLRHDEIDKFREEFINHLDYMYIGNPFNESVVVIPPDYLHRFHYLTYWSIDAKFQIALLSECIVYIMNDKGQTIDSFGC